MKKVYFVVQHYEENGITFTNLMTELATRFHKRGYKVIFLTATYQKDHEEEYSYANIKRFKVIRPPAFGYAIVGIHFAFRVSRYLRKNLEKEDIILANGQAALGLPKGKYVLRVGDQPPTIFNKNLSMIKCQKITTKIGRTIHCFLQSIMEYWFMKRAKSFIFSSTKNKNDFYKEYDLKNKPFFIPRSGINTKKMEEGKKMKLPKQSILFVGSGDEKIRKGIKDLETCMSEIFDVYPDCFLVHVGKEFEWDVYKRHKKSVISVGKVPHNKIKNYYKSVSFVVSTSLSEGFPNVILEAMAAGCPVLTSDIDGIHEYITHMKSGYIYTRADTISLIKGLVYMLDNPSKTKEMAREAQKWVQRLDYDNYFENLLKFIKTKETINLLK